MKELGRLKIRDAVEADRGPVLEFCRNTWPGGDYIADVWSQWLTDRKSRLIVAIAAGVPVGIAHSHFQTREVAWLEGLRVHPSYRGQGIAGKLNVALTKYARQKGAKIVRLCTGSTNIASQRHVEKVGFKVTRTFQRLDSERSLKKKPKITKPQEFRAAYWKWLKNRPELEDFGGMYSTGWTWHPLTREELKTLTNGGQVLFTKEGGALASCSILSREERRLTLGFIAGDQEGLGNQARYMRYMLSRRRYGKVRALLPTKSRFVRAIEDLGFATTGKILVYEKRLR